MKFILNWVQSILLHLPLHLQYKILVYPTIKCGKIVIDLFYAGIAQRGSILKKQYNIWPNREVPYQMSGIEDADQKIITEVRTSLLYTLCSCETKRLRKYISAN